MFTADMSQEQLFAALRTQAGEMAQMRAAMDQLNAQHQQQMMGGAQGGKGDGKGGDGFERRENQRVVLDRKYFQMVDKFDGNPAKFKSWIFDLITAVGSVDLSLSKDLKSTLKERPKIETVDGVFQLPIGLPIEENHDKYPVRCATRHRASSMILFQLGGSDRVHGSLQFFALGFSNFRILLPVGFCFD